MTAIWDSLSGIFGDTYGAHVVASYVATVLPLAILGWVIVAANAKARRDLDGLDKEHKR